VAVATTEDSTVLINDSLHQKIRMIHFGQSGPENQGILSHSKKPRMAMVPILPASKTQKHDEFKVEQTTARHNGDTQTQPM
jgi:hypothetical protein